MLGRETALLRSRGETGRDAGSECVWVERGPWWPPSGPFCLDDDRAYAEWRERKLLRYPRRSEDLIVEIRDLVTPTPSELDAIRCRVAAANMALYATQPSADDARTRCNLIAFGEAFGLTAVEEHRSAGLDGIVRIEIVDQGGRLGYIPYTDRPINWHTDGYYNFHGPDRAIRAMLLHCQNPSASGGVNRLLDPEIAYVRLRDQDASLIEALMRTDAMTIPASIEAGGRVRPENVGPVFFVDPRSGALGMRFTARRRNVVWREDSVTQRSVEALLGVLRADPLVAETRLAAGQGLVCNNVLHDRSAFSGGDRVLYRVRYGDRVGRSRMLS